MRFKWGGGLGGTTICHLHRKYGSLGHDLPTALSSLFAYPPPPLTCTPVPYQEDTVLWARNEGLGDHLRLANPQGETQAGKLFCWACAAWIVAKGCNLKDHVLGKNKRSALLGGGTG